MNISLPSALKAFVDGHVAEGHYATASEYVRELIRNDAKAKAQLEALLLEGLEGDDIEWNTNVCFVK
jgi:antitoxin ParD1/3/4